MIPAKIRRIGLSLAALSLAAGLVAAQVSETIQPSSALEQAREDFSARRFPEAVTKLQSLVESEPENHQARYWLVRALIRDKKPKEALIEAETAAGRAPNDAYAQLALGDALFRKGQFGRAELAYYTALRINPEAPRAYLGIGVVNMAEGRRRSAKIRLRKAFELDPNDMDIVCELATCLPESEEETDLWARYACEATDRDAYELANALAAVTLRRSRPGPTKLVTPDGKEALSIPLHAVGEPTRRTRTDLYLEVRTNGRKPRKFLLDTGASGLLMLEKDARKDGVQPIAEGRLRGVGDDGTRAGSLGWAETVQIGDVRFENFPVRMAKKRVWGEEDGIIGTDVFRAFRVSINPDRQTLSLERLPDLPDDDLSSYDAPAGPPVGFSKMRIVSSKILIDALIADNVQGCLLLDTGAELSLISEQIARSVSKVGGSRLGLEGVSGSVKNVFEAPNITLQFAGVRQRNDSMLGFDMTALSDSVGVELAGIVGRGLLHHVVVTIDYRDHLIRLTPTEAGLAR